MLGFVPSCILVQYQGKLMIQTWGNDKNPTFGPNMPPLPPQFFFSLIVVRQCSKLSSYAMSRNNN